MQAYVAILDFGDESQKIEICHTIVRVTGFNAHINGTHNVVIPCNPAALGGLFDKLAHDDATNWIEYTVQFQH